MTTSVKLGQLAKTIRSKNAVAFLYTLDIIFADKAIYEKVKSSEVLSRDNIARIYGISTERITHFFAYDPGLAFKITMRRTVSSGDIGEIDLYGSQQYIPLLDIEIPWQDE